MTFDEWWKVIKPAECDELKEYFIEAYHIGHSHGYTQGVSMFHEAVKLEREACAKICEGQIDSFEANRGYGPEICAEAIRKRSNV